MWEHNHKHGELPFHRWLIQDFQKPNPSSQEKTFVFYLNEIFFKDKMDELVRLERERDLKKITVQCWRNPDEFKTKLSLRLGSLGAGNHSKRMLRDIHYLLDEGLRRDLIDRDFYDESKDFVESKTS
jgi:hypothetical protein